MTAAVGFPTLRLVRVKIAHLEVENLAPGQWRELTAPEAAKLKAAFSATKMPAERQVQSKEAKSKPTTSSAGPSTGAPARKTFKPAPSNFKRPAGSDQSTKGASDRPKRGPKTSRPDETELADRRCVGPRIGQRGSFFSRLALHPFFRRTRRKAGESRTAFRVAEGGAAAYGRPESEAG
ncbi:hypothetical protein [Hymenobacter radiodurans]|uniref:hypothetical protein n=1 Tax=Hymenobacter radiodurans TaxID=2496028 RepID=UPI001F0F9D13|nr:hypothetical protein [Hymenobacter radiodurans]